MSTLAPLTDVDLRLDLPVPLLAPTSEDVTVDNAPSSRDCSWWTGVLAAVVARYTDRSEVVLAGPTGWAVLDTDGDTSVARLVDQAAGLREPTTASRLPTDLDVPVGRGLTVSTAVTAPQPGLADLQLVVGPGSVRLVAAGATAAGAAAMLASPLGVAARAAAADPARTVKTLPLLADDAYDEVVHGWNDTATAWPSTGYLDLVAGHAQQTPRVPAVVQGRRSLGYADLEQQTNRLAHRLLGAGVTSGDRVGLLCPRSLDYVVAALAILKTGAAVVALDPVNPDSRIALMVADAAPRLVLAPASLLARVPAGTPALDLAAADLAAQPATPLATPVTDDTVSHLIYTSGSTGVPKAVLERHGAIRNLVHWTGRAYGVQAGDRASWLSTPGFAVQIMEWMPYLGLGATVCIPEASEAQTPEQLRDWLVTERVTHAMLVAALAERTWGLDWPAETALRIMVTTAERVHSWPPVDTAFRVVMTYGATETTNALTCLDLGTGLDLTSQATDERVRASRPVPVGRPIANATAYVLDDQGRPVPPGVVGNLYIGGAGLARGYHERPEITADKFRPSPLPGDDQRLYRSGDLARLRDDGAVEVLGRDDAQVKIRGFRVELGEVETAVAALPQVREAITVAHRPTATEAWLVAYVTAEDAVLDTSALRAELAERLPFYMVPTVIVALPAIPRLPNGKTDLRALPDPAETLRDTSGTAYVAPTTEIEVAVARTFSALFAGRTVSATDNFFDLGGHSLLAFQLLDSIRQEFAVELSMTDLYQHPDVVGLAALVVANHTGQGQFADLPPIEPDPAHRYDPFPLTTSQQALWIGRGTLVDLGNVGCHGYFEWQGDVDLERFADAWNQLVQRHDGLRTVVRPDGTQQALAEVPRYDIVTTDLTASTPEQAAETLRSTRDTMAHQVLSEDVWPLFDVRATRLPATDADPGAVRIHLALDFLIADAWSYFQVLIPDLMHLYAAPGDPLPELELTFRDYVLGVSAALADSDLYRRSRWYWTDRLEGLPAAPVLPARPAEQGELPVRFERCSGGLDADQWRVVSEQAAQAGVTPSVVLAAAYAEVLREWSEEPRFCLNFPLFNRIPLHRQTKQIIGDTTTTLLLACDGDGRTFADRARQLQQQMWTDLEHRYFGGVEVLRELTRSRGRLAPAMPVVMTSLVGQRTEEEQGSFGTPVYAISQTPQVSLDFQVFDARGGIRFNWDHLPAVFPDDLVETMFASFCQLLDRLGTEDGWATTVFGFGPQADRHRVAIAEAAAAAEQGNQDRIGAAWERYWAQIEATGRGGDVLWDADSPAEMAWLLERAAAHFDQTLPVVDLGCGNGRYARILAEHFDRVIGVDVSTSAIDKARQESAGYDNLSFEVLDAADEFGAEALAARIGPVNVLIRGVLHVLDDPARVGLAETTARLVGPAGAVLVMEPAYTQGSFGYVGFVGGTKGRAADLVRPLEAAGVRHSTAFGVAELTRFFDAVAWRHLEAEDVVMHAVDPESDQQTLKLPGFYAALRRRAPGLVGAEG